MKLSSMKMIPSVEVLMWVEHWKLSYKGGGDINLAFIKIEDAKDMNIVENSKVKT